jgi:hypothetical protein
MGSNHSITISVIVQQSLARALDSLQKHCKVIRTSDGYEQISLVHDGELICPSVVSFWCGI